MKITNNHELQATEKLEPMIHLSHSSVKGESINVGERQNRASSKTPSADRKCRRAGAGK